FGLIGHVAEMVVDSGFGTGLWSKKIPIIPEAFDYAAMGLVPAGAYKNREFREGIVDISPSVKQVVMDILYDPQTSGGLLICVERENAGDLVNELKEKGIDDVAVIGEVLSEPKGKIVVS
ncbi:MAG: selenide, water dikinase SelD, partial [Desulfobacterales bacterium]|nr:selenide, water dikinase SelD [Desulfobacterales bacterium]